MANTNLQNYLTSKEAAVQLRCPLKTLDQLCFRRELEYIRLGRHRYFAPENIEKFIQAHVKPARQ